MKTSHRKFFTRVFYVTVLMFLSGHSAALRAEVWDVTNDFSVDNGNPNGAWSYGWMDTDFTTFTLYETGDYSEVGPVWYTGWASFPPLGGIIRNTSGYTVSGVSPDQLSLHPGDDYQPGVARWTAPIGLSGSATIAGQFFAGDGGIMLVDVRINGLEVWNAVDSGVFNLATTVVSGDTIDFAVYGGYGGGSTPLDATISVVPEPVTLLLLGLGGLAVIRKRRA
jgi:hypothetical protein